MKILFVSQFYPDDSNPQYCIFLEQQALALIQLGNEVDVLVFRPNSIDKEMIKHPYLQNGIKVYTWLYPSSTIKEKFLISPVNTELTRFLNNNEYDVTSLHLGNVGAFNAIVEACEKLKTRVIVHYHGLNVWKDHNQSVKTKIYNYYTKLVKKKMLRKADAVVGVSKLTCDIIKKEFQGKVYTVYNGVDDSIFHRDTVRTKIETDIFRIVCVANLIPIKGHRFLIEAVADCINAGYRIELTVVGNGPELENLKEQCRNLGVEGNVVFTGTLKYSDVVNEMHRADMFIMPSYFEAFGCVYVEAMASGLVTCGCKNNGAEEVITDRVNGFLVEPKSSKDIGEVIAFVIDNLETARNIAIKGVDRAKEFSWEASALALEAIYKELVKKK